MEKRKENYPAVANEIMNQAKAIDNEAARRILIGGDEAPAQVHYELLGAEVVLLEGIRLEGIEEGVYLLNSAPLYLGQADGAPCRAILIKE